ncbi:MAG: molecular chaperone GrpE [Methanobacterium sp.]|mgnify:FL=1|jgi:molecular chaperone GrpE|uniref:nucleotide exchange factor GrpE n=1 Tax=Methanobacterium sp. TaxID=2164 RepID=UPI0003C98795|nr:nucleotide exchange factor GrpE [Methanobacterium sp.]MDI3549994.1 molecular chaperone GrpE [Methanobacterium sp.]CDG65975.1 protein grpE [Methanobacterium sp. MB1]
MTEKKDTDQRKDDLNELKSEIQKKDDIIKEKEEEIKNKDEKIEQYQEQLLRLQADFDNFKKRTEKELSEQINYANEKLIVKILDSYEDLERALKSGKSDDLHKGVEMIYQNLKKILEGEGLEEIPAEGEKFDPYQHEALMAEAHDDFENGEIIEELSKGYKLNSKVIKYSKVKVCKK